MRDNIMVLGAALVAGLLAWQMLGAKKTGTAGSKPTSSGKPATGGFITDFIGWKYYDGGTAIDPQGNYWQNGVMVYSATMGDTGAGALL